MHKLLLAVLTAITLGRLPHIACIQQPKECTFLLQCFINGQLILTLPNTLVSRVPPLPSHIGCLIANSLHHDTSIILKHLIPYICFLRTNSLPSTPPIAPTFPLTMRLYRVALCGTIVGVHQPKKFCLLMSASGASGANYLLQIVRKTTIAKLLAVTHLTHLNDRRSCMLYLHIGTYSCSRKVRRSRAWVLFGDMSTYSCPSSEAMSCNVGTWPVKFVKKRHAPHTERYRKYVLKLLTW